DALEADPAPAGALLQGPGPSAPPQGAVRGGSVRGANPWAIRPRHWPRWVRPLTAPWSAARLARSIPRVQIPQVPSACWQRDIITMESYVMRSRHLIDPELLPLLEMFPSVPLDAASLPAMRETMKAMIPPALAEDRGVTLEEIWLPAGADGHKVRALVYRPANHAD